MAVIKEEDGLEYWRARCERTGRLADLVNWKLGSGLVYNPFEQIGDPDSVTHLLFTLMSLAERREVKGGEKNPYFSRAAKQLAWACVVVCLYGTGRVDLDLIYQIAISAPTKPEMVGDPELRKKNVCLMLFDAAQRRDLTRHEWENLKQAADFLLVEWPNNSADETRSCVLSSLTVVASVYRHYPAASLISGRSNFNPATAAQRGKIVLLNWPVQSASGGEPALFWQALVQFCWCREMLQRNVQHNPRCCFYFVDEFQLFYTEFTHTVLQRSRSANVCPLFLTQSLSELYAACGPGHEHEVTSLLGHLGTKVALANSDSVTNEYFANLCGRDRQLFLGGNVMMGPRQPMLLWPFGPSSTGSSFHEVMEFNLQPATFGKLRSAGPGSPASGIVHQAGRIFEATGKPWICTSFPAPDEEGSR